MVNTKAPVAVPRQAVPPSRDQHRELPLRRRRGRDSKPMGPVAFLIAQIIDWLIANHGEAFASGMRIEEEMSLLLGELVDTSQVYVTLRRQEQLGRLRARPCLSPHGTGHTVTAYSVTDAGRAAMNASQKFYAIVAGPYGNAYRGVPDSNEDAAKNVKKKKKTRAA